MSQWRRGGAWALLMMLWGAAARADEFRPVVLSARVADRQERPLVGVRVFLRDFLRSVHCWAAMLSASR